MINKHIVNETRIQRGKIKKWIIEILEGLDYLHAKQVIHLDIKPENIFLEELERIKIGDVGMARDLKTMSMSFDNKGTPCYISPQIIDRKKINQKADIWYL
jgi:mitosis inhibitor protein kinase SWE1